MFEGLVVVLILVIASAILALPIAIFVIGHSRKWNWIWRFTSLIAVIVVFYFLFRTPESFFHDEYRIITKMNFPESGEIVYSTSSSISFNGDYDSAFMVELERSDILSLKKSLVQRGFKKGNESHIWSEELEYIESKFGTKTY